MASTVLEKRVVNVAPNVEILEAVSNSGHDAISAIADIVDNSLESNVESSKVEISFIANENHAKGNVLTSIVIADNGCGMDFPTLSEALRLASHSNKNKAKDFGCFGMGLKSSSLSIGNSFKILTKTKDGQLLSADYRKEDIIKSNNFNVIINFDNKLDLQLWDIHKAGGKNTNSGTIIMIYDIQNGLKFSNEQYNRKRITPIFYRVFVALGIIYNNILEERKNQLTITINNCKLFPIDPMIRNVTDLNPIWMNENDNQFLYKPSDDADHEIPITANIFEISSIPTELNRVMTENRVREAITKTYNKEIYKKNHRDWNMVLEEIINRLKPSYIGSGIYIYRNNRLVGSGIKLALSQKSSDRYRNRMRGELFVSGDAENMMKSTYTKTLSDNSELFTDRFRAFLDGRVMKYIRKVSADFRTRLRAKQESEEETKFLVDLGRSMTKAINKVEKDPVMPLPNKSAEKIFGNTEFPIGKVESSGRKAAKGNKPFTLDDAIDVANNRMKEMKLKTIIEFSNKGEDNPICDFLMDKENLKITINKDCSYFKFLLYTMADPSDIMNVVLSMYSTCKTIFDYAERYATKMKLGNDYAYDLYDAFVRDYTSKMNAFARATELKDKKK